MRKLVINTSFPGCVCALLINYNLVERRHIMAEQLTVIIAYPDDLLSQQLSFWLALATGCGLINNWSFDELSRARKSVSIGGNVSGTTIITGDANVHYSGDVSHENERI